MIWFKHPNDLPNDKRLASLIDNEGCRGYGMYLRIIEMLCAQPDRSDKAKVESTNIEKMIRFMMRLRETQTMNRIDRIRQ